MLKARPWIEIAKFCSSCEQSRSLRLLPWEIAPVDLFPGDLNDPRPQRGAHRAHALREKMRALKVSVFHPSPLDAIAEAERATARR